MRATTLLIVLLCSGVSARANDAVMTGIGGSWQPLEGEHKTIQMVRENVRITILANGDYRVTVDFVFRNHGRATTVLMGFPESGGGVDVEPDDFKKKSGFTWFSTWVDGRRAKVRYVFASGANSNYQAHWVKRVRFRRGQTRRVRVRYLTMCGGDSSGFLYATYNFTGGNWRGEVEQSSLTVTFRVPGKFAVQGTLLSYHKEGSKTNYPIGNKRRNRFFYRWRHWQAEGDFTFDYVSLLPQGILTNFDKQKTYYNQGREYIIERPATRPSYRTWIARHAPVALHRGMAVMAMRDLEEWLNLHTGHNLFVDPCRVNWNEHRKTAWLRAGPYIFGFRSGKAHMVINGKVHRLPAPPLAVRDRAGDHLYVPLAPIIKTLGGKIKMVPKQRRVWFHL